jgi:hypothetical protein
MTVSYTIINDLEKAIKNERGKFAANDWITHFEEELDIYEKFWVEQAYLRIKKQEIPGMGPVSNAELAIKLLLFFKNPRKGGRR